MKNLKELTKKKSKKQNKRIQELDQKKSNGKSFSGKKDEPKTLIYFYCQLMDLYPFFSLSFSHTIRYCCCCRYYYCCCCRYYYCCCCRYYYCCCCFGCIVLLFRNQWWNQKQTEKRYTHFSYNNYIHTLNWILHNNNNNNVQLAHLSIW